MNKDIFSIVKASKKLKQKLKIMNEVKVNIINELLNEYCSLYKKRVEVNNELERLILNMLEDASFFNCQVTKDIVLFNYVDLENERIIDISNVNLKFFFAINAIYHQISSWERLVKLLAILYLKGADIKNKSIKVIMDELNGKILDEELNRLLGEFKRNNDYRKVFEARKYIDHGVSIGLRDNVNVCFNKENEDRICEQIYLQYLSSLVNNSDRIMDIIIRMIQVFIEQVNKNVKIQVKEVPSYIIYINMDEIVTNMIKIGALSIKEVMSIPGDENANITDNIMILLKKRYRFKYREVEQDCIKLLENSAWYVRLLRDEFNFIRCDATDLLFRDIIYRQYEVNRCLMDVVKDNIYGTAVRNKFYFSFL